MFSEMPAEKLLRLATVKLPLPLSFEGRKGRGEIFGRMMNLFGFVDFALLSTLWVARRSGRTKWSFSLPIPSLCPSV